MSTACVLFFSGRCITTLLSGFAVAQPPLYLKTRQIHAEGSGPVDEFDPRLYGRGHVTDSNQPPSAEQVAELKRRGIRVLQDAPENGLLVSVEQRRDLPDSTFAMQLPFSRRTRSAR